MSWIVTHFVHPGLLGGLALVAIPILIWLFNRVRYRQIEWAAMTFLLRALKRSQRRLRIENFILLLLRCLVLACFVLALARPRGQPIAPTDPTDARKNIVILLDTSWSTGYQIGSDARQTVLERERRAAKEIVRQLRQVDRVSIVAFDEQPRKIYATPRSVDARTQKEILDEIDSLPEMQMTARGTDYGAAFGALAEVLRRFDAGPDGQPLPPSPSGPSPKSVFLITDNQRSGLFQGRERRIKGPDADEIAKLGARLFVVDCGPDDPKNVGIMSLDTREPIVGTNLPCYIECTVRNWGSLAPSRGPKGENVAGLTLEYYVDDNQTPVKAVSLDLAPEETRQLEALRYVFHDKGVHRVRVELKSDALTIDNHRELVVDVRDAVEVLLVDGDPRPEKWEAETWFIQKVLDIDPDAPDGKGLVRPEVISEAALPVGALRKYALVVLANVASVPDDHVAALEQYVREGGAVVFAMGGLIDRDHYNAKLWREGKGLMPCALGDVKGPTSSERSGDRDPNAPEWIFALADPTDPIAGIFAEEEDAKLALRQPSVYHYIEAKDLTAIDKGAKTLATAPLRFIPRPKEGFGGGGKQAEPKAEEILNGSPALVTKPFGRGRVAAYLTSVGYHRDNPWSHTVAYPMYVALWRRMALELARSSQPRRNLAIGDRYERIIDEFVKTVEVKDPNDRPEVFRPENLEGRDQYRIVYPPTADTRVGSDAPGADAPKKEDAAGVDKPGFYEVKLQGAADGTATTSDWFAVRIDPQEGDIARLGIEDWKEQLPGLEPKEVTASSWARGSDEEDPLLPALRDVMHGGGPAQRDDELWPQALALCIAFLAAESLLAALFGRRRQ